MWKFLKITVISLLSLFIMLIAIVVIKLQLPQPPLSSLPPREIKFGDLQLSIPGDIGFEGTVNNPKARDQQLLFVIPMRYFHAYKYFERKGDNETVPIMIYTQKNGDPYIRKEDPSEPEEKNPYEEKREVVGAYTLHYLKIINSIIYTSNNGEYPRRFLCDTQFPIKPNKGDLDPNKYFTCEVQDHLFNEKLLLGRNYRVEYIISTKQIKEVPELSKDIKDFFVKMIKNKEILKDENFEIIGENK